MAEHFTADQEVTGLNHDVPFVFYLFPLLNAQHIYSSAQTKHESGKIDPVLKIYYIGILKKDVIFKD